MCVCAFLFSHPTTTMNLHEARGARQMSLSFLPVSLSGSVYDSINDTIVGLHYTQPVLLTPQQPCKGNDSIEHTGFFLLQFHGSFQSVLCCSPYCIGQCRPGHVLEILSDFAALGGCCNALHENVVFIKRFFTGLSSRALQFQRRAPRKFSAQ